MKPLPKELQEAWDFAEAWDPSGISRKWRLESLAKFQEWEDSESRVAWRLKWIGVPLLVVLFVVWAGLMVWGASKGFP